MTTQENIFNKPSIEWKDIKGYEGLYQVSNLGRVKSLDRIDSIGRKIKGILIKPQISKKGYLQISLCKGGHQKHVKFIV